MTAAIATHGATLAPLMRKAGFRYVFLGIENVLDDDLAFLKATAKNSRRKTQPEHDARRDRCSPSARSAHRRRTDRRKP